MRRILTIATLALMHFVAYTFCALREFDTASWFPFKWYPDESHAIWVFLMRVLEYPFGIIANAIGPIPDFLSLPVLILNSLLWGSIAYLVFSWLWRRRTMAVSI